MATLRSYWVRSESRSILTRTWRAASFSGIHFLARWLTVKRRAPIAVKSSPKTRVAAQRRMTRKKMRSQTRLANRMNSMCSTMERLGLERYFWKNYCIIRVVDFYAFHFSFFLSLEKTTTQSEHIWRIYFFALHNI